MAIANGRIPSLDGLRAISIALVILGHLTGTTGFPALVARPWAIALAHLGVTIFFVISGFLITSLLMAEREKTGTISLKGVYLRRALRIFPAFYVFILALIVANFFGWIPLSVRDVAFAATYTVNFDTDRSWNIGHLWSLSIEEQFYLLWPFVFLKLRERHALIVALLAFVGSPLVRAGMHFAFPASSPLRDLEIFPAMADGLAIGCATALLRPWLLQRAWYLRITETTWLMLALLPIVFVLNRFAGEYTIADVAGSPLMLAGIALLIEASTRHPETIAGRLLNWKPLAFVGVLSYSLYLWQQPFLNRHVASTLTTFPLNLALAIGAALISYLVVERPLLALRKRLERAPILPRTTQATDAAPNEAA